MGKKKRMGRPPKKPGDRLAEPVGVRFTVAQERTVRTAAKKAGKTRALWLRDLALDATGWKP